MDQTPRHARRSKDENINLVSSLANQLYGPNIDQNILGAGGQGVVFKVNSSVVSKIRVIGKYKDPLFSSADDHRVIADLELEEYIHQWDNSPLWIKNLNTFKREYFFLETLSNVKGVVKPINNIFVDYIENLLAITEMKFVPGENLDQIIKEPLYFKKSISALLQVGQLIYGPLKERGIVHLDINPSNIIVNYSEEATLIDFGIAHPSGHKAEDIAYGTPGFIAPETISQMEIDYRTDGFSWAINVIIALIGENPFSKWMEKNSSNVSLAYGNYFYNLLTLDCSKINRMIVDPVRSKYGDPAAEAVRQAMNIRKEQRFMEPLLAVVEKMAGKEKAAEIS
ncbi:MAG TPA: protein kinase [Candidatus Nanoarchaeia archaeon]|nr:protein kinase [Candidatus Nanoarchaeia archaeon]